MAHWSFVRTKFKLGRPKALGFRPWRGVTLVFNFVEIPLNGNRDLKTLMKNIAVEMTGGSDLNT